MKPILEARGIRQAFGRVTALRDVSVAIPPGRVTCLLGDNGAGKSTLVQILSGVRRPTRGRLLLDGEPVEFASPREARERGIATVYQDLALLPLMSVWRNFFLGAEPTVGRGPFRRLDVARCREVVRRELAGMGIDVGDPSRPLGTLSGGQRQAVAIARALHFGARVLILDEPTAALGVRQAGIVLDQVRRARERGAAVVLVTHNPSHAFPVGDRYVLLSRGRVVGEYERDELSPGRLADLMAAPAARGPEET